MKLGRNDLCWCKSGKKYKSCHLAMDQKLELMKSQGCFIPDHDMIKNDSQISKIREAGKLNTEILDMLSEHVKEGVSTGELDRLAHEYTLRYGAVPAPLGFEGFPKSICTSIDEVVCHGIPDSGRILKEGEIINIDVTTILNGYYADASRMFGIGQITPEKDRLMRAAKECLELGVSAAKPWGYLGDIGYAIHSHAAKQGYSIVEEIGGHGVGLDFHEEPWVSHIGQPGTDMVLAPGMIFTIEPMVNMGKASVRVDDTDGWTVRTEDGLPSAQWEYTILITKQGNEVLTK